MISLFCPFCKHVFKAPDECAGNLVGCEQCKLEIRVPHPAATPPLAPAISQSESGGSRSWWRRFLRRGETTQRAAHMP